MVKTKKRGTSGNAKNYITRSQAVRKLQITLPDFRRLCIFKGIYPREPRSKKRASKSSTPSTTFYYARDIQYLLHEPLLNKFRDQKALAKKISKALGRNEVSEASRLERNLTPRMKMDHIIKERYPTFVDALRDLDDALSLLFLFSNLPSSENVPPKTIAKCQRLTREFEHYLIRTHNLRKSFLSIKGIYYQATVQGQDILWLVPYKFVQRTAGDVDFRIMATFVEFYTTLLGFINYRLYTGIGLVYPPKFDQKSEEQGAELGAFQLEDRDGEEQMEIEETPNIEVNSKAQAEADKLLTESGKNTSNDLADDHDLQNDQAVVEPSTTEATSAALDQFASIDPTADSLFQPLVTADATIAAKLFEPFTFYLSRETPRHPLEVLLKAFGCKRVGWDSLVGEAGSYCAEDDKRITHQIVDRPELPLPSPPLTDGDDLDDGAPRTEDRKPNGRVQGRIYIQPQWVWDSINAGQLQRTDLYTPGATLPPHLSPWVKAKKGEYDPSLPLSAQQTEAEAEAAEFSDDSEDEVEEVEADDNDDDDDDDDDEVAADGEDIVDDASEDDGGMDVALADSDEDDAEDELLAPGADFEGFSEDEQEDLANESARKAREHQSELEAEAQGRPVATLSAGDVKISKRAVAQAKRSRTEREAAEDVERRKMMMSRRKRKVYEKMVYSNARKDEESEKLRAKRRKIEKSLSKENV